MMAMTLCWLDLEKINITSEVTDEGPITFKPLSSDRTQATDDSDIDGAQPHPHQPWHAHGDQVSSSCQHNPAPSHHFSDHVLAAVLKVNSLQRLQQFKCAQSVSLTMKV